MKKNILFTILSLILVNCNQNKSYKTLKTIEKKTSNSTTLFSLIANDKTNFTFKNNVEETPDLNFLNFGNIYNGGGVATADFNNDGLVDVFFVANQNSNKLYLNEGGFKFKDITETSGLKDAIGWSTGVSVVDINNDGWLDIYICKSGSNQTTFSKENKLFINQKNNTFIDKAKGWKINDPGFSTQSYFFDFDKDGDLDLYLVNHRPDFENTGRLNMRIERDYSRLSSDILYRNDGSSFTEITHEAGIVNKAFGLSASIGDFNNDGWPDIYVCNDFLTPDKLYINNKNGKFTDEILNRIKHTSFSSMGSDYADLNNDLHPDLFVLEMAFEDHVRSKQNMASMNTNNFNNLVKNGYNHQYMVNTLQLNRGNGNFSEIAQISGLAKTDWSWTPLIADFDNDGLKDIFVSNGILKDMANQDFRTELSKRFKQKNKPSFKEITDLQPSTKIQNYAFKNEGNLNFSKNPENWGLKEKTQSNGAAYADFDNDGDLDLVINNINDTPLLYQNNDTNNFIQIKLKGDDKNKFAIGSKIAVTANNIKQYQELYTSRGFISSVENIINFGVGDAANIDEILIEWPNQKITKLTNIKSNQIISVNQENAISSGVTNESLPKTLLQKDSPYKQGIAYKHNENDFNDYKKQILLPHSQSTNGPFIDKSDVNGDGLEDFFIGGAKGQSGELYFQDENSKFIKQDTKIWQEDKEYEDLGVLFLDIDNDKDNDLYVVSGGAEFEENSNLYQDRIYINDGKGNFSKGKNILPKITSSGQTIKASDIDNDGDLDLFVGGRVIPDKYPYAPESYILINENGKFYNKTKTIAPAIKNVGLVTDAIFSDYDNDSDEDLIVVGEWMPITIFENNNGTLKPIENNSLKNTEGIWFSIESVDIDNDGDIDYFVGNLGLNTKYKASTKKPFHVFCDDFDNSGTYDIVLTSNYKGTLVPSRGLECSSQQMPFIKDKFPTFTEFSEASLEDIYGKVALEKALHLKVHMLNSVFLENDGGGNFSIKNLPKMLQIAPIMDFEFIDINNDNQKEIIAIGNHYNAEVETVRYDASLGSILSYKNKTFEIIDMEETGFVNIGNSKDIIAINKKEGSTILITNNDDRVNLFNLHNK
ncbi:VCBS repeat-containing protein [Sabulilitoribacter arenilitoris]|uniref:VCBS repeat-containing protein n=1 Tax=Wocania arenilitoris TaxID=2044858 RepID=A0AAE3ESW2_9FLAO|nr:VCBS repeat-containing protein [Wocania arenilitoris]MCF7569534.1 VCBS repeat-containing protein [Wocania arenilitoris]